MVCYVSMIVAIVNVLLICYLSFLCSVIVSQWVTMLNVVEHHLTKEGFHCCTIQGNVPVKQRSQLVDDFNSDPHGPTVSLRRLKRLNLMCEKIARINAAWK